MTQAEAENLKAQIDRDRPDIEARIFEQAGDWWLDGMPHQEEVLRTRDFSKAPKILRTNLAFDWPQALAELQQMEQEAEA